MGLEKLLAAESDVGVMKEELIALQPKLIETSKEVEVTIEVVDRETQEAEAKREVGDVERLWAGTARRGVARYMCRWNGWLIVTC